MTTGRFCLAAAGYTTLCFLPALLRLVNADVNYFRGSETFYRIFLPVLACQVAVCAVLFLGRIFHRVLKEPFNHILVLIALLWPADGLLQAVLASTGRLSGIQKVAVVLVMVCGVVLARSLRNLARSALNGLAFLGVGSLAICIAAGGYSFHWAGPDFEDKKPHPLYSGYAPVRLVWIVFDELDPGVIAEPSRFPQLPSMQRLAAQSLVATHVLQSAGRTRDSIPGLLMGRSVLSTKSTSPGDLQLTWQDGGGTASWRETPGVLDDVSSLQLNTAVVGWYHPYGRILAQHAGLVLWRPAEDFFGFDNQASDKPLAMQAISQFYGNLCELPMLSKTPWFNRNQRLRSEHIERTKMLVGAARKLVVDPRFGLVFLHLPVPHPPGIWNRRQSEFSAVSGNYLDNLLLTDRVIESLESSLSASGVKEKTAILITADHGWRKGHWRTQNGWTQEEESAGGETTPQMVPFLLHFPDQTETVGVNKPLRSTVVRPFVSEILKGRVTTAEQAAAWLTATK